MYLTWHAGDKFERSEDSKRPQRVQVDAVLRTSRHYHGEEPERKSCRKL